MVTIENVSDQFELVQSGFFPLTGGDYASAPIFPGESYEFSFSGGDGARLSFVSMFVESNDWFLATQDDGLPLFDEDGDPVTGDISNQLAIFDAGTEKDEPPGEGPNQPMRQPEHDAGDEDPDDEVRVVADFAAEDFARVELAFDGASTFTLTMKNVSEDAEVPTPFAPGVFAVHTYGRPLFRQGKSDRGEGLEDLAEDGDPSLLVEELAANTGLRSALSPGLWVVHKQLTPLFTDKRAEPGNGLRQLAEDGDPSQLLASMSEKAGIFALPLGGDGPAAPGDSFEFSFRAPAGTRLSFATMLLETNDSFIAPDHDGIELFEDGEPISGSLKVYLWDAGSEENQPAGLGSDQPPRQSKPGKGDDENGTVRRPAQPEFSPVKVSIEAHP